MPARVIGTRLPCCPGRDSRFTIRHNPDRHGNPWWVYYEPPQEDPIPADEPHAELVQLVNGLKQQMGQSPGGGFSINEYGQVIARTRDPNGVANTVHVINVDGNGVTTYTVPIEFNNGELSPLLEPDEGDPWTGPLSGMTYKFVKVGNPKPPSRRLDEVFIEEEGVTLQLSTHGSIDPYPPTAGPLAEFLRALRRQLPEGGRFRVNEHRRAFTSDRQIFVGIVPIPLWFQPLHGRS